MKRLFLCLGLCLSSVSAGDLTSLGGEEQAQVEARDSVKVAFRLFGGEVVRMSVSSLDDALLDELQGEFFARSEDEIQTTITHLKDFGVASEELEHIEAELTRLTETCRLALTKQYEEMIRFFESSSRYEEARDARVRLQSALNNPVEVELGPSDQDWSRVREALQNENMRADQINDAVGLLQGVFSYGRAGVNDPTSRLLLLHSARELSESVQNQETRRIFQAVIDEEIEGSQDGRAGTRFSEFAARATSAQERNVERGREQPNPLPALDTLLFNTLRVLR